MEREKKMEKENETILSPVNFLVNLVQHTQIESQIPDTQLSHNNSLNSSNQTYFAN